MFGNRKSALQFKASWCSTGAYKTLNLILPRYRVGSWLTKAIWLRNELMFISSRLTPSSVTAPLKGS